MKTKVYKKDVESRTVTEVLSDGGYTRVMRLNETFVQKQARTEEDIANILNAHIERLQIIDKMFICGDYGIHTYTIIGALRALYADYIDNQCKLQQAWGFNVDPNMHDWYAVPYCKCPVLDNNERKGTPYRIYNEECPIHGTYAWSDK